MAEIVFDQKITLDFNTNNAFSVVSIKQGDSARRLAIYLTKDGNPYQIDPTHGFYFRMRKPDGKAIVNPAFAKIDNANIDTDSGYVVVEITEQTAAVAGRGYADLIEYDDNGKMLSTICFIVNVMSSPAVGEGITSSNEFQALTEMLSQADKLLGCAPTIGSDGMWYRWDGTFDSGGWEATNVTAEGQDGIDGSSFFIVDTLTGSCDSQVSYYSTSVVPTNTSYYSDKDCTIFAGETSKLTAVEYVAIDEVYKISNIPSNYYVKSESVESSDPSKQYYIFTIPQGSTGPTGETGATGARGPAGAGGVTWVDGKDTTAEVHFEADADIELINRNIVSNVQINGNTLSWDSNIVVYDDARQYVGIAFTKDNATPPTQDDLQIVSSWNTANNNGYTNGVILKNSITLDSDNYYLWGRKGTDSGDVRLYSVSYTPQSQFVFYTDMGLPSVVNIDSTMQSQARANINAMKNITGTSGQLIKYGEDGWKSFTPDYVTNSKLDDTLFSYVTQSNLDTTLTSTLSDYAKTVNSKEPDENGNINLDQVKLANEAINIQSYDTMTQTSIFSFRTTGGDDDITSGDSYISEINGRAQYIGGVFEPDIGVESNSGQGDVPEYEVDIDIDKWDSFLTTSEIVKLTNIYKITWLTTEKWDICYKNEQEQFISFQQLTKNELKSTAGVTVSLASGDSYTDIEFLVDYQAVENPTCIPTTIYSFKSVKYNLYDCNFASSADPSYGAAHVVGGNVLRFICPDEKVFYFKETLDSTPASIELVNYTMPDGITVVPKTYTPLTDGYIISEPTSDIMINLIWSGKRLNDTDIAEYEEVVKPISNDGLVLNYVNGVYDSLDLNKKKLHRRIGRFVQDPTKLYIFALCSYVLGKENGSDYIYVDYGSVNQTTLDRAREIDIDTFNILSQLSNGELVEDYSPPSETDSEWNQYWAEDFGTEEIILDNNIKPEIKILYSVDLIDKLRNRVVTYTAQSPTDDERLQAISNLGLIQVSCYVGSRNLTVIAEDESGNTIIKNKGSDLSNEYIIFILPHLGKWTFSTQVDGLTTTSQITAEYYGKYSTRLVGKQYGFRRAKNVADSQYRIEYIEDAENMTPAFFEQLQGSDEWVFNPGDWGTFIEEVAEPVVLDRNGLKTSLNRNNQNYYADGTAINFGEAFSADNNFMVEFRKYIYVKRYEDNSYEYVLFSDEKIDDSYYNYATTTLGGQNAEKFYWGMFEGSFSGTTSTKLHSFPSTAISTAVKKVSVMEQYANNIALNSKNQSHWHINYKSGWDFICDLITLITKNDNAQDTFGPGIMTVSNSTVSPFCDSDITRASKLNSGGFIKSVWQTNNFTDVKFFWIYNFYGNAREPLLGFFRKNITSSASAKNCLYYVKMVLDTGEENQYGYTFVDSTTTNTAILNLGYVQAPKILSTGSNNYFISGTSTTELGLLPVAVNSTTEAYICDAMNFSSPSRYTLHYSYGTYVSTASATVNSNGPRCLVQLNYDSALPTSVQPRLTYV